VAARNDCIADGGLDAFLKRLLEVVKAGFAGGCYGKASALKWLIALRPIPSNGSYPGLAAGGGDENVLASEGDLVQSS